MKVDTITFQLEAERRLIETFELMNLLGLRNRGSVWRRVEAGTLPAPVFVRDRVVALWDRDAVVEAVPELAERV